VREVALAHERAHTRTLVYRRAQSSTLINGYRGGKNRPEKIAR
jgi:hypothetical protein